MGKPLPVTAQTVNAEQRRREAVIKQRIAERRARLLADDRPSETYQPVDPYQSFQSQKNYH